MPPVTTNFACLLKSVTKGNRGLDLRCENDYHSQVPLQTPVGMRAFDRGFVFSTKLWAVNQLDITLRRPLYTANYLHHIAALHFAFVLVLFSARPVIQARPGATGSGGCMVPLIPVWARGWARGASA